MLEVKGLQVVFPLPGGRSLKAVRGVDLSVDRGAALAVVGESGCGKSTVARAILRLVSPSEGQIYLNGTDMLAKEPGRASAEYRRQVQMVFQDPFASLNPVHSALHHIVRPLRIRGLSPSDANTEALQLMERVGLTPAADLCHRFPHELSGGQRQRLAIARALAVQPSVLVADEPTSMLDMSIRVGILGLLKDLCRERGLALIMITHDLGSARAIADHVAVLFAGLVVETGPMEDVLQHPRHPYTQELVRAAVRDREPTVEGDAAVSSSEEGCVYASRCARFQPACSSIVPQLKTTQAGREVRCLLSEVDHGS